MRRLERNSRLTMTWDLDAKMTKQLAVGASAISGLLALRPGLCHAIATVRWWLQPKAGSFRRLALWLMRMC